MARECDAGEPCTRNRCARIFEALLRQSFIGAKPRAWDIALKIKYARGSTLKWGDLKNRLPTR
jgi:hypothetical protein